MHSCERKIMFETKRNRSSSKNCPAKSEPRSSKRSSALLVAASEGDANMLYAVGFFVPDPFIFFQHKNTSYVVMSDLEIDRAKKQAHVDRVLSLSLYQKKLRKLGKTPATNDRYSGSAFPRKGHSFVDRSGELFRVARPISSEPRATACRSSAIRSGPSAKPRTAAR